MYTDTEVGLNGWGCAASSGVTESIVVNSAIAMVSEPSVQVVWHMSSISPLTLHASQLPPSSSELWQPTVTGGGTGANVGAITGGAVGGLAVVVLGGVGLFLVLSLRKWDTAAAAAQGQTAYPPGAPPAQPMVQPPPMAPTHHGGYPDQIWNNQVFAYVPQPQMMPQQQSHQAKSVESEVTMPVDGPSQHGAQSQLQYYPPQQQGYYTQQPQQPQQLAATPPAELLSGGQ